MLQTGSGRGQLCGYASKLGRKRVEVSRTARLSCPFRQQERIFAGLNLVLLVFLCAAQFLWANTSDHRGISRCSHCSASASSANLTNWSGLIAARNSARRSSPAHMDDDCDPSRHRLRYCVLLVQDRCPVLRLDDSCDLAGRFQALAYRNCAHRRRERRPHLLLGLALFPCSPACRSEQLHRSRNRSTHLRHHGLSWFGHSSTICAEKERELIHEPRRTRKDRSELHRRRQARRRGTFLQCHRARDSQSGRHDLQRARHCGQIVRARVRNENREMYDIATKEAARLERLDDRFPGLCAPACSIHGSVRCRPIPSVTSPTSAAPVRLQTISRFIANATRLFGRNR